MPDTQTIEDHKCIIVNITKNDLAVLDAYTDATATKPEIMYEQTLKNLGTIPAGTSSDGSPTVLLEDYHKDPNGNQAYNKLYDLIIARADNLFPVLSAVAVQQRVTFSDGTVYKTFNPVTIMPDAPAKMSLAENFIQTITAFPTSDLSKGYVEALSDASNNSTSDSSVDTRVNTFFQTKTKEFKSLTLDMVIAVQTYYSQYPFVWADYKGSKTYYLYASDGTSVAYAGEVDLVMPNAAAASADKSLPGAVFAFSDASTNKSTTLYYSDGLFVDDKEKDLPGISLRGLFTLKSSLTKNTADNTVIAVLSGTVNSNQTVLGYPEKLKQDEDDSKKWSGLYTMLHPKDAQGLLQLFLTVMGVVMGIEVLGKGAKWLKDKFTKKKVEEDNGADPAPSEISQMRSEFATIKQQILESNQKLLDKMNAGEQVPEDVAAGINDLQQQTVNQLNEEQRTSLEENLNSQETVAEQSAEYQVDQEIEDIGDKIDGDLTKLDKAAAPEDLSQAVTEVKADIPVIKADLAVEVQESSSNFSTEEMATVQKAQEASKTAEETSESIEKSATDAKEGNTPEEPEFDTKIEVEA